VVVVGHLGAQVRAALTRRPEVCVIENPDYRKGAVVSLWAAREHLAGDVLVMDADVLFPTELLRGLVDAPHHNCFLMDTDAVDDGEAMMLMARAGRVVDIARGIRGDHDTRGESVGFLKLDTEGAAVLRRLAEAARCEGRDDIEHEALYPDLMRSCRVGYVTTDAAPWTEIDFPADVERARRMLGHQ
jgi:choline kinase